MKYTAISIIFLFTLLTSCKEDDVALLDCESNVSLIINGKAKCGILERTGYSLDLDENIEAIGILLNPGADISENKINIVLAPLAGSLFIEGKSYDYQSGEGSSFWGSRVGTIYSANIKILKLDREKGLLTIEVYLKMELMPSNDTWEMSGILTDLKMDS
ncbi:MAG: hypothetical protein AB8B73_14865 [Ekhidna sp.]